MNLDGLPLFSSPKKGICAQNCCVAEDLPERNGTTLFQTNRDLTETLEAPPSTRATPLAALPRPTAAPERLLLPLPTLISRPPSPRGAVAAPHPAHSLGSTPAVLHTSLPHAPLCCRLPACFLAPERAHTASPGKHWPRRQSGWSLRARVGLSGREAEREPASPGRRGAVCWISSSETEPQGPASPQQKVQMAQAPYLLPGTKADQPPVQFSHSVVSDSLRPHGLQHARPPCPSPTPRVYSNSCPLSR